MINQLSNDSCTSVGTAVNVTCPSGQKLSNNKTSVKLVCDPYGRWRPALPDCISKRIRNTYLHCVVKMVGILASSPLGAGAYAQYQDVTISFF